MKGLFIDKDVTRRRKETDVGKQWVLTSLNMKTDIVQWQRHHSQESHQNAMNQESYPKNYADLLIIWNSISAWLRSEVEPWHVAIVAVEDVWLSGLSKPSLGKISHYTMAVIAIIANKAAVRNDGTRKSGEGAQSSVGREWTGGRLGSLARIKSNSYTQPWWLWSMCPPWPL